MRTNRYYTFIHILYTGNFIFLVVKVSGVIEEVKLVVINLKVSGVIEEVKLVVINLRFRELKRTSVFPFADTIVLRKAHNFHFYFHFYSHFYFRKLS